jgi:hypothetical protein
MRLTIAMLQRPNLASGECLNELVAGIGAVGEEVAQPGKQVVDGLNNEQRSIAVLDIGGMNRDIDLSPVVLVTIWRLRPLTFWAVSPGSRLCRARGQAPPRGPPLSVVLTDWLSITSADGLATRPAASRFEQEFEIDPFKWTVVPPIIKVVLHGGERRKVLRQQAPPTAGPRDVPNAVKDGSQIGLARPPQMLNRRIWSSITVHSASVRSLT